MLAIWPPKVRRSRPAASKAPSHAMPAEARAVTQQFALAWTFESTSAHSFALDQQRAPAETSCGQEHAMQIDHCAAES